MFTPKTIYTFQQQPKPPFALAMAPFWVLHTHKATVDSLLKTVDSLLLRITLRPSRYPVATVNRGSLQFVGEVLIIQFSGRSW